VHYSNVYFSFYNYNFENRALNQSAKSSFFSNEKKINEIRLPVLQ